MPFLGQKVPMSLKYRGPYSGEVKAIVTLRKFHPKLGPFKLASQIKDRELVTKRDQKQLERCYFRSFYSIYSVIRRYDAGTLKPVQTA